VREAIAVMHADYAAELTLDDVARQIATSRRPPGGGRRAAP